jgi:O-antigen/teichoic acid export membrane protein
MHDSLRRSSSFLLGSSAVGSVFGFVFWLLCAHLTSSTQIGYAASLLAYVNLYSTITTLGFTNAVIRFLPHHKNRDAYFGTVSAITFNSSLILGAGFLYAIKYFSPKLLFAVTSPQIFGLMLLIIVISSLSNVADAALLAQKDAKSIFLKVIWQSPIRVLLPFVFFKLDLKTMLIVYAVSSLIGLIYEYRILYRKHHKRFVVDTTSLVGSYRFTAGNFMGTIFGILPTSLVPIIILNQLGASLAAYAYVALQFASLLSLISSASAQAYLSEASNDHSDHYIPHLVKALKNLYSLLLPAAFVMAVAGAQALRFYGHAYYSGGAVLLILLCGSSIFVGINWLGDSLLNVQKRPFAYGVMNFINAALVIAIVRFTAHNGLSAVGWGWLSAQALTVVIYLVLQGKYLWSERLKAKRAPNIPNTSYQQSYPKTNYHYTPSPFYPSLAMSSDEWRLVRRHFQARQLKRHRNNQQMTVTHEVSLEAVQQPASQTTAQV